MIEMATTKHERGNTYGDRECAFARERINALMEEQGLTQKKVALVTGKIVPQGRLSDLLLGKVRFTERTLAAVAGALGVQPSALLPPPLQVAEPQAESDPASAPPEKLPPGLGEFLRGEADDITPWERRELAKAEFKADPGDVYDREFWADILAALRKRRARLRESGTRR